MGVRVFYRIRWRRRKVRKRVTLSLLLRLIGKTALGLVERISHQLDANVAGGETTSITNLLFDSAEGKEYCIREPPPRKIEPNLLCDQSMKQ